MRKTFGRTLGWIVCGLGGALALAACTARVQNTGYVPTSLQLEAITPGQDTRGTVADKVGAPPLDNFRSDDVWYYLASRTETLGLYAPVETYRELVAIRFSSAGAVTTIEHYGLDDGQVVTLSRRVTDPTIPDIGVIQSLLRGTSLAPNLGQTEAPQ